jgi:hypothetical protein
LRFLQGIFFKDQAISYLVSFFLVYRHPSANGFSLARISTAQFVKVICANSWSSIVCITYGALFAARYNATVWFGCFLKE